MRVLSYSVGGDPFYGVVVDDGVVNARGRFGIKFPTLRKHLLGY